MKKAILSIFLSLCMMCTLLPLTAEASEPVAGSTSYNIWVGGVQVTSVNAANITGGQITVDTGGKVSYNAATNTLTLKNATIGGAQNGTSVTDAGEVDDKSCIYANFTDSTDDTLTINLEGTNTLNETAATQSSYGIYVSGSLVFTGNGSLNATSKGIDCSETTPCSTTTHAHWSIAIYASGNITINRGCTITATSGSARTIYAGIWNYDDLILKPGVTAKIGNSESDATLYTGGITSNKKYMKIEPAEYAISLENQNGNSPLTSYTFPDAIVGYADTDRPTLSVSVKNIGTQATGELAVTLSGTNASAFDAPSSLNSILLQASGSFTVRPKADLPVGTYTATVAIGNNNVPEKSFTVSFTVKEAPTVTMLDSSGNPISSTNPPRVGDTLSMRLENFPENSSISKMWDLSLAGSNVASGLVADTYTLPADSAGKYIEAVVGYGNNEYAGSGAFQIVAAGNSDSVTPPADDATPSAPAHEPIRRQNTTTTTVTTPDSTTTASVTSPKTGDMGIAVYAALSIISMSGSAWIVGTKRRH